MFIALIPFLVIYLIWKLITDRSGIKAFFGITPPLRYIVVDLLFVIGFVIFEMSLLSIVLWLLSYYDAQMVYNILIKNSSLLLMIGSS